MGNKGLGFRKEEWRRYFALNPNLPIETPESTLGPVLSGTHIGLGFRVKGKILRDNVCLKRPNPAMLTAEIFYL